MKTFGSIILGFLMTIFIFIIALFLGVRFFLSPMMMTRMIEVVFEEEGGFVEVITEGNDEMDLAKYVDEEEINKELGKFFSDYLKYSLGVPNQEKPSLDGFKEIIDKAIDEYVKDTGSDFDYEEYNSGYEDLEKEMDEDLFSEEVPQEVKTVFSVIYSDTVMLILILLVAISLLIDYLIRKDLLIVLRHAGIVSVMNGAFYASISSFIFSIETDGEVILKKIVNLIAQIPGCIAIIGIVLGIALIALSIVLRKKKDIINNGLGFYAESQSTGPVTITYN